MQQTPSHGPIQQTQRISPQTEAASFSGFVAFDAGLETRKLFGEVWVWG